MKDFIRFTRKSFFPLQFTVLRPINTVVEFVCLWGSMMVGRQRQLTLNKGAEKFVFRYDVGRESELIDALIDQAKDTRTEFDWFDAAVLSFKLTQSLVSQADELLQANGNLEMESGNLQG